MQHKGENMAYIDQIKERAKIDKKTIVLPESTDKRVLIAASKIMEQGIANIILVGNPEKIHDGAGWLEIDLDNVVIVDPENTPKLDEYTNLLYELRKPSFRVEKSQGHDSREGSRDSA